MAGAYYGSQSGRVRSAWADVEARIRAEEAIRRNASLVTVHVEPKTTKGKKVKVG